MLQLVVLLSLGCAVASQTFPEPPAWPSQHTRTEVQFEPTLPGLIVSKPIFYDFTNFRYRADMHYLSGPTTPTTTTNFSSYWIGTDLYMYTWAPAEPSCIHLNLGFGIMRPNWFLTNSTQVGDIWLAVKSDPADATFHHTVWTRKSAEPFGYFDYFTDAKAGTPFRLSAPTQTDYVINEIYNFTAASLNNTDVFDLPSSPACKGMAMDDDAHDMMLSSPLAFEYMVGRMQAYFESS